MPAGDLAAAVIRFAELERRLFRTSERMTEAEFDRAFSSYEEARARMFDLAGVKEGRHERAEL